MKQVFIFIVFVALSRPGLDVRETVQIRPTRIMQMPLPNRHSQISPTPMRPLAEGNRLLDENQTRDGDRGIPTGGQAKPGSGRGVFQARNRLRLARNARCSKTVTVTEPCVERRKEAGTKPNSEKAFEKAVEAYKKWLEANPNDDVAHFNLGRTYAKLRRDDERPKSLSSGGKIKAR